METMNIYSQNGDKVRFCFPYNGHESDRDFAGKFLIVGDIYTVKYTVIAGLHTSVYLEEVPYVPFNSVHFENVI